MNILLDTHVLIWALALPHRLTEAGRGLLTDGSNRIFVSSANIFEIAVKRAIGRGELPPIGAEAATAGAAQAGYTMLNITPTHAAAVEHLPLLHGDPFDRLLLAQALTEPLRLLTHDTTLARYSDTVICFG